MPPYTLPTHKTISGVKSNSSKGGKGFNEIRFEDKKGEEQIFVHGEKNQDIRIKNDCFEWIGRHRHLIVKHNQFEHVEENRHEIVDLDHTEEIGKDRHLAIDGKEAKSVGGSHSFTVSGNVIEVFKSSHSEETTQTCFLKAQDIVIEAITSITLKCGGSTIRLDPAQINIYGGPYVFVNSTPPPPPPPNLLQAVAPAAAEKALEADDADPGAMAEVKARQREIKAGKYGSTPVKPFKPSDDEEKTHWIEIELVDEDGNPVPGERYRVTLPDGQTVAEGTLDENGFVRLEGLDPGTCRITFQGLDREAWDRG